MWTRRIRCRRKVCFSNHIVGADGGQSVAVSPSVEGQSVAVCLSVGGQSIGRGCAGSPTLLTYETHPAVPRHVKRLPVHVPRTGEGPVPPTYRRFGRRGGGAEVCFRD